MNDTINDTKKKMQASLEHLKDELKNIRTGRANPAILDSVTVEAYGSQMRIKELATVTAPEARTLLITPFDQNTLGSIGKGIERANLGLQPIVDGNVVRIQIPPMDEQKRKEMVKLCHSKGEECKVSVRNARREANDHIKRKKTDGDIPEDVQKKLEKEIQELTDKHCKLTDEITTAKEKEITTI